MRRAGEILWGVKTDFAAERQATQNAKNSNIQNDTKRMKNLKTMKKLLLACIITMQTIAICAQHGEVVGGDISMIPQYEASNTVYLDGTGKVIPDLIPWLKNECGWNSFRVRLFVNPTEPDASSITGVVQDINYVKALGKRIKDAGGKFLLDIHYSDTWADPATQKLPASWAACTTTQAKADNVYEYTKETLQTLKAAGATPDFVQVGNEITYGMVGIKVWPYDSKESDWDGFLTVLKAGCKAVREICPNARIVIHTERSGEYLRTQYFYKKLATLDYDIIGLSYYPFYHNTLAYLINTLKTIATDFPSKKVHIVETAYPIQWWPKDAIYDTRSTWPVQEGKCDGQYAYTKDLIKTLASHPCVTGLYWWFPEEAGNGDGANWDTKKGIVISQWLNRGLWWPTSSNGHWPLQTEEGGVLWLMKSFLNPEAAGMTTPETAGDNTAGNNRIYNINGQYCGKDMTKLPKGIYIQNERKIINK